MDRFGHGSTTVLLAPPGVRFAAGVHEGQPIRMGVPLLVLPATS
jgi:phosphatidylserine decarboxylase